MAKGKWIFESREPWQLFAQSFESHLKGWRGPMGAYMTFEDVGGVGASPFAVANSDLGQRLDVYAQPVIGRNNVASGLRFTLFETSHGTRGVIDFWQSLGAAGKDLGSRAQRSALTVDSAIQFQKV